MIEAFVGITGGGGTQQHAFIETETICVCCCLKSLEFEGLLQKRNKTRLDIVCLFRDTLLEKGSQVEVEKYSE